MWYRGQINAEKEAVIVCFVFGGNVGLMNINYKIKSMSKRANW